MNEERKQKIFALLADHDLDSETSEQIKDIIQEDIDSDESVPMTADDQKEIDSATEELSRDLTKIEKDLDEDMAFVDKEMNDLETTVKDLGESVDKAKIASIKSTM